jgi:hypothetical protein
MHDWSQMLRIDSMMATLREESLTKQLPARAIDCQLVNRDLRDQAAQSDHGYQVGEHL